MKNPYSSKPDYAFWKRSVAGLDPQDVDPVTNPLFKISPDDRVATAGSCFAQHISQTLRRQGFNYLVTEPGPKQSDLTNNYGVFPARFGNVYTVRQLLQLFQRAYGLFIPVDCTWQRADGVFVDPFRPLIQAAGFRSIETLEQDREQHLTAVRRMFEDCDVFIFTLGLTEAWRSTVDGAVFPVAPGISGGPVESDSFAFCNFNVTEMNADLSSFISKLRIVNPEVRIMLTVSPVPLVATYEDRHVLVSTIYSKSALRVVAETVCQENEGVAYFPSYEIVTGHHMRYRHFEEDLRSVTSTGVDTVMSLFSKHYLMNASEIHAVQQNMQKTYWPKLSGNDAELRNLYAVVCDEEVIEK